MYRKLSQTTDRVQGFRISGAVTPEDFRLVTHQVESALHEHGAPVCLLVDLRELENMGPAALWEELDAAIDRWDRVGALAVVADGDELKRKTARGTGLPDGRVRHFDTGDIHQAWEWLAGVDRELLEARHRAAMEREPDPVRSLLVAVDLTPTCHFVIRTARMLAEKLGARLALIHVVDTTPMVGFGYDWPYGDIPGPPEIELETEGRKRLESLAKQLEVPEAELLVRCGDPRASILEAAGELQADLIVIGDKSRRGLSRLLGSTANGVVHAAHCAVLTVPVPH